MADHSGDGELLTAAEERELAYRIEVGALAWEERHAAIRRTDATAEDLRALEQVGRLARQRFVRANLGLVAMLARACAARTGLPRDDLFQEGCLGLLIAVARFDHRRGLRFSTYAVPWIRARLGEAVQRRGSGPSLPAGGAGRLRAARVAEDELVQTLGRDATPAEVAASAGLDRRRYERLLAWQRIGSLDDELDSARLSDRAWMSDQGPAPEEVADRSDWTADRLLWHLAPQEQAVLRQRYGLAGERAASYAEIARRLGMSGSSVRRIELRALRRLRDVCAAEAGRMTA